MPDHGAARRALRTFAATVLVTLGAAAPAAAQTVEISGSDSRNCWVASNGVTEFEDCNSAYIGQSGAYEFRGLLWFDIAAYVPDTALVTDAYLKLPLGGYDEEDVCGSGLHLRAQSADWLTQTPTWTTPDGTTLWDGGSSTWSHISHYASTCDESGVIFDLTGPVGDLAANPEYNLGWSLVNGDGTQFAVSNNWGAIPQLFVSYE
ncbi:DNRLRE domain-containing protein [Solirubrobacter sp. CPCC 204708]|uniref:DNRLRE domain-containing protein n=1 Tax=Solirubrobacter deserti TaxID=2282478 RepID=A0ABT4RDY3_9ACTN|nr:DNRLRE domain-containing protein [Solirubrobacter deserti]MBE2314536.1 DNRLRE domain-containing protein [Solirubrobacter deserti]MDA0136540.1 DNRLRE domain-containing protein [Solirubrobacter deserti]